MPEMPVLSKEVENNFALNALLLNIALLPAAARHEKEGTDIPQSLVAEIAQKMGRLTADSPKVSTELIRRADRIKELEAQIAEMLLTDASKKER